MNTSMAVAGQLVHPDRRDRHPVLVVLDFLRNADLHLALTRRVVDHPRVGRDDHIHAGAPRIAAWLSTCGSVRSPRPSASASTPCVAGRPTAPSQFERRGNQRVLRADKLAALTASVSGPDKTSSARNRFHGVVVGITRDRVMAQVEMVCGEFRVVSLMSREAADELGLEVGKHATAVIKSTNVIVEV